MVDVLDLPTSHTDETVLSAVDRFELLRDYVSLLDRLHGLEPEEYPSLEEFFKLLHDPSELLVFVVQSGQVVSTAQASLSKTIPVQHVYINNVVTHDDHEGCGHGRRVMETLLQAVKVRWGENGAKKLRVELTNSPSKENAGFYEKLGFIARTKESDNETVVWFKEI